MDGQEIAVIEQRHGHSPVGEAQPGDREGDPVDVDILDRERSGAAQGDRAAGGGESPAAIVRNREGRGQGH